jgi:WD40 repeat protein
LFNFFFQPIYSVCFSKDGSLLFSGGGDNVIKVWNIKSLKCVNTVDAHEGNIYAMSMSPNGIEKN